MVGSLTASIYIYVGKAARECRIFGGLGQRRPGVRSLLFLIRGLVILSEVKDLCTSGQLHRSFAANAAQDDK
jgi:hypothetical protein